MKLFVENNPTKYPIILGEDTDSTPSGYLDETSIEGVGGHSHLIDIIDYNNIRDWVLELMLAKDTVNTPADMATAFGLCTVEEQKICCEFQLMPYAVRLNYFTDAEDKVNWDKLVMLTEGSPYGSLSGRNRVYQDLRICVSDYVRREVWFPNDYQANLTYAQQFLKDVHLLKEYYIASNDVEFGQFLKSIAPYDTTGFNSKNYWRQDLEDDLLEIYNSY